MTQDKDDWMSRSRSRASARRSTALVSMAAAGALVLSACGSSATSASSSRGPSAAGSGSGNTLDIASFVPFSGADASFGDLALSGCYPATYLINKAGGVLGHRFACTSSDTRGDPVDAVPAANALIAHASNLAAVFGPSSDEALATQPLFSQAQIPTFLMAGNSQFDRPSSPYVWRFTPADAAEGYAMAAWAQMKGFHRAAAVFATGNTSQGDGPAAISGFQKLGGQIVANIALTPGQPSYNTEVSKIIAAKPQVIFFTAPADTSATFFSEMKQLGSILPTYVTEVAEEPNWINSVAGSIGASSLQKNFIAFEAQTPPTTTSAWATFHDALLADPQKVSNVGQYTQDPFTLSYYDAANLVALAMLETHSVKPSVYNSVIMNLATAGSGKTVVSSFAEGKNALASGHQIEYVGADGALGLNKYHNVAGDFRGVTVEKNPTTIGSVPQNLINSAQS